MSQPLFLSTAGGRHRPIVLVAAIALQLTGCSAIQDRLSQATAAPPLDVDTNDHGNADLYCRNFYGLPNGDKGNTPKHCAAAMLADSENKCVIFMNKVFGNKVFWDTALGITSLAASTVGAAVGPAQVARGFSAAAGVLTGSRSQLDADIYANAGPGDFFTAMSSTYNADALTYYNTLSKLSLSEASTLDTQLELSYIRGLHAKCSMDAAEATIKATLAKASVSAPVSQPSDKPGCPSTPAGAAIHPPCPAVTPS